jgi:tripartite-type tricarboxylate transporter receptor subunit TctC
MLERHHRMITLVGTVVFVALAACAPAAAPAQPTSAPSKPTAAPTAAPQSAPAKPTAQSEAPVAEKPAPAAAPKTAEKSAAPAVDLAQAASYFGGKTITFTVGYAPGGGYDTYARIVAVHMGRHIPGTPEIVVTNMPGAGSLSAVQTVMRKAPGNGMDLVVFTQGLLVQSALGEKLQGFDPTEATYLGAPDWEISPRQICARTDVANSLDAFLQSPRKLKIGESATQSGTGALDTWMELAGLPVQAVFGYGGTSEINVALERGELDLTTRCTDDDLVTFPHWFTENLVTPLFYFEKMPEFMKVEVAKGRYPWYKQIYDVVELSPQLKHSLELNARMTTGQRMFALPPRTPEMVTNALRKAFADTVADPAFRKDIADRKFEVGLKTPEDIRADIDELQGLPPDVLTLLKQMYKVKS